MWIRRIIWIALIFLAFILYLFANSPATLTVLLAFIILPAFSYFMLKFAATKTEVTIEAPETAAKKKEIPVTVHVKNKGFFPAGDATFTLQRTNVRTGEKHETPINTGMAGNSAKEIPAAFSSDHCGKINIDISDVNCKDIFGMFVSKKDIPAHCEVTVFPERFGVNVTLTNSASAMTEGDEYSKTQKGSDSAETVGIKEYVPGDPVKNMHWKLSSKLDKLLVREFGMPVVKQVCMVLDMSAGEVCDAKETDSVADVFSSISDALFENEIAPVIAWQDPEYGTMEFRTANNEDDLKDAISEMMSVPVKARGIGVSEAIAMSSEKLGFAHVIVVGVNPEIDMVHISNGARATLILPDQETIKNGVQKDGTGIISYDKDRYKNELSEVEI